MTAEYIARHTQICRIREGMVDIYETLGNSAGLLRDAVAATEDEFHADAGIYAREAMEELEQAKERVATLADTLKKWMEVPA